MKNTLRKYFFYWIRVWNVTCLHSWVRDFFISRLPKGNTMVLAVKHVRPLRYQNSRQPYPRTHHTSSPTEKTPVSEQTEIGSHTPSGISCIIPENTTCERDPPENCLKEINLFQFSIVNKKREYEKHFFFYIYQKFIYYTF